MTKKQDDQLATNGLRVLVCGGRKFFDAELVNHTLDSLNISHLIEGGAKGADKLAYTWAYYNLPAKDRSQYPAKWKEFGKGAGYIRNEQMLKEGKPDLVVAFPGNKGTEDMISKARKAGVKVMEIW